MKKQINKISILFISMLVTFNSLYAQEFTPTLPNVVPPSPEARALFRFVDHPVNHSIGIPDINVPIYTIQTGMLTLPISISYHAGGRKIEDVTGPVGLGWSLNVGGMISRTIHGHCDLSNEVPENMMLRDDLEKFRYIDKNYPTTKGYAETYKYLSGIYNPSGIGPSGFWGAAMDSEYDIFSFMTSNYSGKFIVYGKSRKPKLITRGEPVEIEYNYPEFIVKEPTGVKYIFSANELKPNGATEFYLRRIESPNEKDYINFTYKGVRIVNSSDGYQAQNYVPSMIVTDYAEELSGTGGAYRYTTKPESYKSLCKEIQYGCQRISEIDFGSGKITFDFEELGGKVKSITVQNSVKDIIKKAVFKQSIMDRIVYDNYKLDKLVFMNGSTEDETYSFSYNPSSNAHRTSYDFWGYKNGNTVNSDNQMFPSFTLKVRTGNATYVNRTVGNINHKRSPNLAAITQGMLNKITYPTGGSTSFTYEMNRYKLYNGKGVEGVGVRIAKISTSDANGKTTVKTYEYVEDGILASYQPFEYSANEQIRLDATGSIYGCQMSRFYKVIRTRTYSALPTGDMAFLAKEPVFYREVIEHIKEGSNILGKTHYYYGIPYRMTHIKAAPKSAGSNEGYVCKYTSGVNNPSIPCDEYARSGFVDAYDYLWRNRKLTAKEDYKYDNNKKEYEAVKGIYYSYIEDNSYIEDRTKPEIIKGIKVFRRLNFPDTETEKAFSLITGFAVFTYDDYEISCGSSQLVSVMERFYFPEGNVGIETTYEYDKDYPYNVKQKKTVTSNGPDIVNHYYYVHDDMPDKDKLTSSQQKAIGDMKTAGYKTTVVQQITKRNNVQLYNNLTGFTQKSTGFFLPETVYSSTSSNILKDRIKYHNYDSFGNPMYVTKDDADKLVYLWSYNGKYPIAEIKNMTYEEVKNILGQTLIDRVASAGSPTVSDMNTINNLRTNTKAANASVTTYTYKPLVGVLTMTDPSGRTVYYDYDSSGRLKKTYIKNGTVDEILEVYEYNYVNK